MEWKKKKRISNLAVACVLAMLAACFLPQSLAQSAGLLVAARAVPAQTVEPVGKTTLVYTGEPQKLIKDDTGTTQDSDKEFRYSLTDNGEYTAEIPSAVNAGTYTVYYRLVDKSTGDQIATESNSTTATINQTTYSWNTNFSVTVNKNSGKGSINLSSLYDNGVDKPDSFSDFQIIPVYTYNTYTVYNSQTGRDEPYQFVSFVSDEPSFKAYDPDTNELNFVFDSGKVSDGSYELMQFMVNSKNYKPFNVILLVNVSEVKSHYEGITTKSVSTKYGNTANIDLSSMIAAGGSLKASTLQTTDAYSALSEEASEAAAISGNILKYTIKNDPALSGRNISFKATVAGGANYEDYDIEVNVTVISKDNQTIAFPSATVTKTYGDDAFTVAVTGAKTAVKYSITTQTTLENGETTGVVSIDANTGQVTILKSGIVEISATAVETNDYKKSNTVTYELTVNKRQAILAWTQSTLNFTYDGNAHKPSATITNLVGTDTADVSVSGQQTVANGNETEVTYTATATDFGLDQSKYLDPTTNRTTVFTISRRPVTVKADNKEIFYGQSDPTLTVTITGMVEGESESLIQYLIARDKAGLPEGKPVGEYDITANWNTTAQGNYQVTFTKGKLTIKPAVVTVSANSAEKVYGDTDPAPFTATVSGLQYNEPESNITYTVSRASGEDVGEYTITPSGDAIQGNYSVVYVTNKFTITKATATVTAVDKNKVYGNDDPELTAEVTGLQNGDEASVIAYTISRENAQAEGGQNVGTYTITPAGDAVQGNYNVIYVPGTLTITKATVTITAENKTKVYGVNDPDFTATVNGLKYNDTATNTAVSTSGTVQYSLSRAAGENVGEYPITPVGNAEQGNYDVVYETGKLTITKANVTVSANNVSKTYGDADPAAFTATITGLQGNDTAAVLTYSITRERPAVEDAGEYALTPSGAEVQGNYTVTYVPGKLTINRADVTVTAENKEKVYGQDDPTFTANVTGLTHGDTVSELSFTYSREKEGDEGYATRENVGGHPITPSGNAVQGNYNVTYLPGTLTITKATVTVSANSVSKVYGATDPSFTATVTGLQNGDAESTIRYSISRAAGDSVGEYTITPAGEAVQGNYDVVYKTGILTISKAAATVTAANKTKVYGDTDPELTATVTGLQNGDTANVISYTKSRAAGENVGEYAITPAGAAVQGNYTVTYVPAKLTITQAPATVSANSASKVYGDADPELTATVTGLQNGDTEDKISYTTSRAAGEDVGTYAITPSGEASQGNYTVTYVPNTLTIDQRKIIIEGIKASDKTYDGNTTAALTYDSVSFNGITDGSGVASVNDKAGLTADTPTLTVTATGTFANANAGADKDVTISNLVLGGSKKGNYKLAENEQQQSTATATINPKELTLSWTGTEVTYDGAEHCPTAAAGNLVGQDTCQITVQVKKTDDETLNDAMTDAGTYTAVATRIDNTNYALPTTNTTVFKIKKAPQSVNMDDWTYGDTPSEPTVSGNAIATYKYKVKGAEGEFGNLKPNNAGSYTVQAVVEESDNYLAGTVTDDFEIKRRGVSLIWGDTYAFDYDGQEHAPAVSVDKNGMILSDDCDVEVSGKSSDAGSHTLTVTGLTGGSSNNYTLPAETDDLSKAYTINRKAATITAADQELVYPAAIDTAVTKATATGLVDGEELSEVTLTEIPPTGGTAGNITENSTIKPSAAKILRGTKDVTANYDLTYSNGTLVRTAGAITPKVSIDGWTYGETAKTPSVEGNPGEGKVTYTYKLKDAAETAYVETAPFKAGTYTVRAQVAASGNYAAGEATADFKIAEKALTITAKDQTITYPDEIATGTTAVSYDSLVTGDELSSITVSGSPDTITANGTISLSEPVIKKGEEVVTDCYDITLKSGKLVRNKASMELTVSIDGWTYGEDAKEPTVSGNDANGSVTYTYKKADAQDTAYNQTVPTDAGDYIVKATIAESTNYNSATATRNFTIATRALKITAKDQEITHPDQIETGVDQVDYTAADLATGDFLASVTLAADTTAVTDNGNVVVSNAVIRKGAKETIVTENYEITYVNGKLIRHKAAITPSVTLEGWTYGDTANTPVVEGNSGNGTVKEYYKVADADDNTYTTDVPENANDYTLKVTIDETAYYEGGEATCNFSIAKAKYDKPAAPVMSSKGLFTVTLKAVQGCEYKMGANGEWQDENTFTGLSQTTEYTFYQRMKADDNHYASDVSEGTAVTTDTHAHHITVSMNSTNTEFDTIIVSCKNQDMGHTGETTTRFVVNAESRYGDGTPFVATVTGDPIEGVDVPMIEYYDANTDTATLLNYAPYKCGHYWALITMYEGDAPDSFAHAYKEFDILPYDVTLHTNGGTIAAGKEVTKHAFEDTVNLPGPNDITKRGSTFLGWYDNEGLTGTPVAQIGASVAGDKEYWAKWELIPASEFDIVTSDPQNRVYGDDPSTIRVAVTKSAGHTYAYQWYEILSDDEVLLEGETDAELQLDPKTAAGYHTYRCIVTATRDDSGMTLSGNSAAIPVVVAKKEVTVYGITAEDKMYDASKEATLSYKSVSFNGIVEGDELAVTATGTFTDAMPGKGKTVVISALMLDENAPQAGNYALAEEGNQTETTADITIGDDVIHEDILNEDGSVTTIATTYENGEKVGSTETTPAVDGSKVTIVKKDADGNIVTVTERTLDAEGRTTREVVKDADGKVISDTDAVEKPAEQKPEENKPEEQKVTPPTKEELEANALALNAGLKVKQTGKKIVVEWGAVDDADTYDIYVGYCGKKFSKEPVATVTKGTKAVIRKIGGKKLDLKKNFKLYVVASNTAGPEEIVLGKTVVAHVVGVKNKTYTNAKKIVVTTPKNGKIELKKGKTFTIKAKTILVAPKKKQLTNAHAKEFRYATSDKSVATVDKKGKIKAVGEGTATIYVYSRNGYTQEVQVSVK